MLDLIATIFSATVDVFLFKGRSSDQRTHHAYVAAWRSQDGRTSAENVSVLRDQFKQHSAPGAYVDPDGDPLAPWIESWCAGMKPRAARWAARRARAT